MILKKFLNQISSEFGTKKIDDLFSAIGYGRLSAKKVIGKLVPKEKLSSSTGSPAIASVVRRVFRSGEAKIKVKGFDDLMVFRARCCSPIRGEKIVGYITRGKGVSVHAAMCSNVLNLLYDPERRIDVVWDKSDGVNFFTVHLSIEVEDRQGILADITAAIAGININVRKVEASSNEDQQGRISVTMDISDLKHLQKVSKIVRSVTGVREVERLML